MNKAIFLDKDGTLIKDVPYNVNPDAIWLLPGVVRGLTALHHLGYKLIIITNQSGVAHGHFDEKALRYVEERLRWLLGLAGIPLAGFYYCPHYENGSIPAYAIACTCRKPEPGLIQRAAQEHKIDCGRSWMIGDILHDVEVGRRAGCRAILVDNGGETEWELSDIRTPHFIVNDLIEAAHIIANQNNLLDADEHGFHGLQEPNPCISVKSVS